VSEGNFALGEIGRPAVRKTLPKKLKNHIEEKLKQNIGKRKTIREERATPKGAPDVKALSAAAVEAHALDTFGSRVKATHWLGRPNPLFEGRTPLEVLQVDPQSVEIELVRIDHGVYV
jgi:uncharacterized protein (DUF2384 family)